MLRHTALFLHRDTISEDQKLAMLRGLAFLRMECAGVRAGDYGQDLFGGSSPLRAVPPWKRTPRWRARREGPSSNYDVALHLDFDDEAAMARYLADDAHRAERDTSKGSVPRHVGPCPGLTGFPALPFDAAEDPVGVTCLATADS